MSAFDASCQYESLPQIMEGRNVSQKQIQTFWIVLQSLGHMTRTLFSVVYVLMS